MPILRSQWDKLSPISKADYATRGDGIEDDPIILSDAQRADAAERAEYQKAWERGFINLSEAELAIAAKWFPNMFRGRDE